MIALGVVVPDALAKQFTKACLDQRDDLRKALLAYRASEPLSVGIQMRAARWQIARS